MVRISLRLPDALQLLPPTSSAVWEIAEFLKLRFFKKNRLLTKREAACLSFPVKLNIIFQMLLGVLECHGKCLF